MAFDTWAFPGGMIERVEVLRSASGGSVRRRRRFPRPPVRLFRIVGTAHTDSEMSQVLSIFDGARGSAALVNITAPGNKPVTGRFVSSSFSYRILAPNVNSFSFELIEEPRIA